MTISRLLTLLGVLVAGLGVVIFIPRDGRIQPCRVKMELPVSLGGMTGKEGKVLDKERAILAEDTQFCRKVYEDPYNQVLVSIVLSGNDLDSSIHRPERCLPAQGWTVLDSQPVTLDIPEAPGGKLTVMRLRLMQEINVKGQAVKVYNLNYYWFIGYNDITANHFMREYIDMKDRLVHGYNQRWAYVTVASTIMQGLEPFGKDEAQTDQMLQRMITEVFPQIVPGSADATAVASNQAK
jgi:hypothetical protein